MQLQGRELPWSNVPDLLRAKSREHGDAVFCEIDGRCLSYKELDRLSDTVAGNLSALGVRPGNLVASVLFNCVEQLIGWLATNKLGGIWTPLNAGLTGDDLAYALNQAGAQVVIVEDETWPQLKPLLPDLPSALTIYSTESAPDDPAVRPFASLLEPADPPPPVKVEPGDPAMIIFSGGTTGRPKGVLLPHFAFICVGYRYRDAVDATGEDRLYTTLPMFHVGGTQLGIVAPMMNDMTVVMDRRFSASRYWLRVAEAEATIIDPLGTMMAVLCEQPERPEDRQHRVRVSFGVTGQVPTSVPSRFSSRYGIPIVDIYGLTEAGGGILTSNRIHDGAEGTLGRTHGWADIAILDQDDRPVSPGMQGEIVLRPTVPYSFMLGYHNDAERTVEVCRNFWLHTGDFGRLDEAGNLIFDGRQAHWLRRRGENISAYEVESIIARHPDVQEVIVVGVPAELGEEDVKAFVIVKEPSKRDPVELVQWCAKRMAAFKVPRFVEYVEDFPRSAAKREVERTKIKEWGNGNAWDREKEIGRMSSQSGRKPIG